MVRGAVINVGLKSNILRVLYLEVDYSNWLLSRLGSVLTKKQNPEFLCCAGPVLIGPLSDEI